MDNPMVLERAFFSRPALQVAPDLLGKVLVNTAGRTAARIVETEAYDQDEPACHGHNGPTPRNQVLFGTPGHAYVYFTYGMHWCVNAVTGRNGRGEGVLLRAAVPVTGSASMRQRRGDRFADGTSDRDLLRGPACLTKAMGLDGNDNNRDLSDPAGSLRLADDGCRPDVIDRGPRVGVRLAPDLAWRFWVHGSPNVSRYARHPKAAAPRSDG